MTSKQVWTCVLAGPCAAMSAFWLIFFSDKSDSAFDKLICHCLSCRGLPIKGKKLNPSFFCFYIGFPCFPRQNVFIFPGFSFVHSHELWSFRLGPDACFTEGNPPPDHASLNESMFWAGLIVDSNNSQDCPVDWLTCFGLDHPNPVFFPNWSKVCVCVCDSVFAGLHGDKVRVSVCHHLFMWASLRCVQRTAYQYLRRGGTGSGHLDGLSDCDLRAHARLLCFLTRQPDKLVVVWTRRSRRKSSKVCNQAKSENLGNVPQVLLQTLVLLGPLSHSPTAGSLASRTPTEEWWCGPSQRTSRSPSHFLRCKSKLVSLYFSPSFFSTVSF